MSNKISAQVVADLEAQRTALIEEDVISDLESQRTQRQPPKRARPWDETGKMLPNQSLAQEAPSQEAPSRFGADPNPTTSRFGATPNTEENASMLDRFETKLRGVHDDPIGAIKEAGSALGSIYKKEYEAIGDASNEINYGLTSMVPGAQGLLQPLGVGRDTVPEGEAPSALQGAGRMVGMAGSTAAMMAAAPAAAAAKGVMLADEVAGGIMPAIKTFVQKAYESSAASPTAFWGMETGSAALSGLLGAEVYRQTENEYWKTGAELLGGAVLPIGNLIIKPVLSSLSQVTIVGMSLRALKHLLGVGTPSPLGKVRASKRLQRATDSPGNAVRDAENADVLPEANLSFAKRSQDQGLLSLEENVLDSTDALRRENRIKHAHVNQAIRNAWDDPAFNGQSDPVAISATPEEARAYLNIVTEGRISIAATRMEERLSDIPHASKEDVSRIAKEEINKAKIAAERQEDELWKPVDLTLPAPTRRSRNEYKEILSRYESNEVKKSQTWVDIPPELREHFGELVDGEYVPGVLKEHVKLGALKDMRSLVLKLARAERAENVPNRDKQAVLARMGDALLDDMMAIKPTGPLKILSDRTGVEVADALTIARNYSADINIRFRQGEIGQILGYREQGDPTINAMLILQRTIGKSKLQGVNSFDELMRSVERTGDPKAMRKSISEYLYSEFLSASHVSGEFMPASGANYVKQKADLLTRLPEVRTKMEAAIKSGKDYKIAQQLTDPDIAVAAMVLKKNPGDEIKYILSTGNPERAAAEVVALLKTDPDKRALPGFRKALLNYIWDRSITDHLDYNGVAQLDGEKFKLTVDNVQTLIKTILSPAQRRRLKTITNTAYYDSRAAIGSKDEGILDDVEGYVLETARKVLAASLGRNAAREMGVGGTLQAPSESVKFSTRLRDMGIDPGRKLVVDAITSQNDDLMRELLLTSNINWKTGDKPAIQAWIYATAAEYGIH